jgi:tape measure domain-containing protein
MAFNMDAVLRIVAKVDGDNALQKLGSDLVGVGQKAGQTLSPFGQMNSALRGIANVAATIGLVTIGRDLLQSGIEAQAASIRINALAKSFGEVEAVTEVAARAAQQFALGNVEAQNAVTDLYGRLRPMGVSLKDIETVFFGVNKAAKQVGLSSYDTSEVLLQLSQALGSGALQGDELRSIMERMPAVGQAVAKVMGVSASEVKKLGSEGMITTDVMIRAAAELNKIVPPPPTPMQEFEKALKDLRTELGENLLPILTPFIKGLTALIQAFAGLPEPVQTTVIALGALAIAAGPIASVITGIGKALIIVGGIASSMGVIWAGFQTVFIVAMQGILSWVGSTLIPGLLAFFTGPVGWTVLAVAAVVAMAIAFREPIMNFFSWLGGAIADGLQALWQWGEPIRNFWAGAWTAVEDVVTGFFDWLGGAVEDGLQALWQWGAPIRDFWKNAWNAVKGIAVDYFKFLGGVVQWGMQAALAVAYQVFVTPWVKIWENVLRSPVNAALAWIRNEWQKISQFLSGIMDKTMGLVRKTWSGITSFFDASVVAPIRQAWNGLTSVLSTAMQTAISAIQGIWGRISQSFVQYVTTPIGNAWNALIQLFPNAMVKASEIVRSAWTGMVEGVKGVVRGLLQYVVGAINGVIGMINKLISAFNRLPGPDIGLIGTISVPAFATGGIVNRPTLAMVGEEEREYIVPESKMAAASSRFLGGARGAAVIPSSSDSSGGSAQQPVVNITTGPVVEMQGQRYITVDDLQQAVQQTASQIYATLRTPAGRRAIGVA